MAPFGDPLWQTRGASPYYNDTHRRLQHEVREYVSTHIAPFCNEWEAQGYVPPAVLSRHARLGYAAVSIYPLAANYLRGQRLPGDIEHSAWDGFHDLIIIDEIARCGYLGVIWALSCGNSIGAPPLVNFGNEEQKRRFLPDVLRGQTRFCLGVTEPDGKCEAAETLPGNATDREVAGSDVARLTTHAERSGSHYVVNGAKKWITNGIFADYCTAAVRTGGPGAGGISALIIPLKLKASHARRCKTRESMQVVRQLKLTSCLPKSLTVLSRFYVY
jgi:alkylation response protein AidB-like acyl-CoA dehydrogenase